MNLITKIFVLISLIVTNKAQTCTPIQGCDAMTNGSCYSYVDDNLNWNQAEHCCVAWGGHLASIHSNGTNILLNNIRNQSRWTWIGFSDTADDGVYTWTDGTPFDYDNSHSGILDNDGSCFHFLSGSLTWNDTVCSNNSTIYLVTSYICQRRFDLRCSKSTVNPTCMAISNTRVDNCTTMNVLRRNENAVSKILMNIQNLTIGERVIGFNDELNADIIALRVNPNKVTNITFENVTVDTNPKSFPGSPTVVSAVYRDKRNFTSSERILSEVITIVSSKELKGHLTITYITKQQTEDNSCYSFSNGTWSQKGINTTTRNYTVVCMTENLSTFALLSNTSTSGDNVNARLYQVATFILLSVSLLFLLASIIAFLVSWRKVFRIDINVMNFHHGIALFLAIFVNIFRPELSSIDTIVCHVVSFIWLFFWTNVFLSSLSISIPVFYSIWIVGIKHVAKKLSPYLIPISWSISFLWALIWLVIEIVNIDNIHATNCIFSRELIYIFNVPMQVIVVINLFMLLLILLKIRRVFKNKDRDEKELVRLRRVAFGGLLLVPNLGLTFIFAIPLSFLIYIAMTSHSSRSSNGCIRSAQRRLEFNNSSS